MGEFKLWMETQNASAGMVVQKNGKVLLMKTKWGWELPKGHIDSKESPRFAASRETEEEAGSLARPTDFLGWVLTPKKKRKVFFYRGQYQGGKPRPQKEEGVEKVKWMSLGRALDKIVPHQKAILKRLTHG